MLHGRWFEPVVTAALQWAHAWEQHPTLQDSRHELEVGQSERVPDLACF